MKYALLVRLNPYHLLVHMAINAPFVDGRLQPVTGFLEHLVKSRANDHVKDPTLGVCLDNIEFTNPVYITYFHCCLKCGALLGQSKTEGPYTKIGHLYKSVYDEKQLEVGFDYHRVPGLVCPLQEMPVSYEYCGPEAPVFQDKIPKRAATLPIIPSSAFHLFGYVEDASQKVECILKG